MRTSTLWQVMTPTTRLGDQTYVTWRIAADHRREAERMAEQVALSLGLYFRSDIQVDQVGKVYVP